MAGGMLESSPRERIQRSYRGSPTKNPTKPLKSLISFPYPEIFFRWYRESKDFSIFKETIADLGIKGNEKYLNSLVEILHIAADIVRESRANYGDRERYIEIITRKHDAFFVDTPHNERPSIVKFDSYFFSWATKIWPRALDLIREYERRRYSVDVKELKP